MDLLNENIYDECQICVKDAKYNLPSKLADIVGGKAEAISPSKLINLFNWENSRAYYSKNH